MALRVLRANCICPLSATVELSFPQLPIGKDSLSKYRQFAMRGIHGRQLVATDWRHPPCHRTGGWFRRV